MCINNSYQNSNCSFQIFQMVQKSMLTMVSKWQMHHPGINLCGFSIWDPKVWTMMKLSIGANVNIQWMEDLLIYNYIEIIWIKPLTYIRVEYKNRVKNDRCFLNFTRFFILSRAGTPLCNYKKISVSPTCTYYWRLDFIIFIHQQHPLLAAPAQALPKQTKV